MDCLTSRLRYTLLFTLLSIGISSLCAQSKLKFTIDSFENDQFDMSAINKESERYDGNGDKYAIVKVSSTNPDDNLREYNFNFGNMNHIVDDRDHDGELWIFVQKNAKMVTITREGYAPINRYTLPLTIDSGKVYRMTLSSEGKKVFTQWVEFHVNPADCKAVVHIKGNGRDAEEQVLGFIDSSGSLAKNLVYGKYSYKVTAENYHLAEGIFTLNDKNVNHIENVTLRPSFSNITLISKPDVEIFINGVKKSQSGIWEGILNEGNYQVECKLANHRPTSQSISVKENNDETIELKNPEPILGTLSITSTPLGGNILIDGTPYGETPRNVYILIGNHHVEISKKGYQSESKTVMVAENETETINLTLGRTTTTEITCTPSHASISIDGIWKALGSYTYNGDVGEHDLTLTADGYKTIKKKVLFGDNPVINFSLTPLLVRKNDFYIEAGASVGSALNIAAAMGAHISNFNIEADYEYGFAKSPDIYWNYTGSGDKDMHPELSTYSPSLIIGGKIGYGFIAGTRFKFTPQVGMKMIKLKEQGDKKHIESANCMSATLGIRTFLAVTSNFGVSLTPEYMLAVKKSNGFKALSDVSDKIKGWGEGFNVKIAVALAF